MPHVPRIWGHGKARRPFQNKAGFSSAGTLTKGTVPLPGGETAIYNSTGLEFIRHTNYLGSSVLATTWAHAVYSKESYAPFGETYNEAGTADRSFTGEDQDTVPGSGGTGIYDYLFRKYDPSAGRWLSPDPLGWGAVNIADPQSLDRYAYVENQPMSAIDPNGESYIICVSAGEGGQGCTQPMSDSAFWAAVVGSSDAYGINSDGDITVNGQAVGTFFYVMDPSSVPLLTISGNPQGGNGGGGGGGGAPNNVINNALHAAPLPVASGVCSIYGNQQYMGASLQCVCQSAGNSAWSQDTRGCLAADYNQGVPEVVAHGSCYAGSTYRTETFPAQTLYNAYMSCKTW